MDNEFFRQKGAGQVSTGQEQEAIDANPSEQSGTNVRMGAPVWKQFVVNKAFQEANQAGIQAERDQMRMAEAGNRRASRPGYGVPMFKGGGGKLIRVLGGRGEELDPEEWTNDPEAGPIARKSLWDREIKTAKREASDSAFRLKDPAFHAKSLKDKDREDFLAEGDGLAETDPRHIELKAKLKADDEYRAEKDRLAKHSYDREAYARQLEVTDPETWFQNRSQPTAADSRAALVAETQAKRSAVTAADNSAADEGRQIRAEFAQGVKGPEVAAKQARLAEIAAARGTIAQEAVKAEEPVKQAQQDAAKEKDFFRVGDTVSGIWDAVRGLGSSAPAAFYQLVEGMDRPDQYSDSAKAAFAEADAFNKEMQAKTAANQAAGTSSSVGESFREAGGSLGFSLGSMAAAIPASIAGAKVGAATGGAIGAAVGAPAAGAGAAPGAVLGASIGGTIGGVSAGMAASGTAAYRMAGASFLNEAFQNLNAESQKKSGRPMNEAEMASAYEALLPIAKNTALWEAGPEAVGNAVTMGAGKIIFGLGKPLAAKFATTIGGKAVAGAGSLAVELAGETVTNVEQSADQQKAQAIAQEQDPNTIKADWTAGGVVESFKEVAPQTLALMGLMGGAGGALKIASKVTGIGETRPDGTPATPEDFKPQIDTALAAIDPEISPADPAEIERAVLLGGRGHGPAEVAQAVLIERELVEVEAQEAAEIAAADAAIAAAVDPKERKAAEGNRELLEAGRADTVRAVVKIAAGQNPHDLTVAELASLGMVREGDEVFPMDDKEREKAGISEPMADVGPDGSVILTDAAIKRVKAASPTAGARIAMPEATARQKAQQRADQISADSQNGGPGDPVTGSSPGGEGVPIETNAAAETSPTEFDVPMRVGPPVRVTAATAAEAESEAAAMFAPGENAVLPGQAIQISTNENNETNTTNQAQSSTPVGNSENAPGAEGESAQGVEGDVPVRGESGGLLQVDGASVAPPAAAEAPEVQPGTAALVRAKAKLAKIKKKSPKIAAALNVTNDPAARAEAKPDGSITINPERVIAEAMRGGMNETQAADYFDRVLDEEIRHAAQYAAAAMLWKVSGSKLDLATWRESHYAGIWKSDFSGKKGDAARDLYTRTDAGNLAAWDAMSDGDKALEAIRIMSQDQVTEEAIFLWTSISDTLRTALKAALQSLKSLAQAASPTLQQEITNLENALRSLTESQPRRRSPKADPAQPAQGGETAGNAPPAAQAGAGEAASGRGAVPPRSEGTGAPLAVGARVEFEINGRTVTGVVRDVRDGVDVVSVRLDENPDVPVRVPKKNLRVIEASAKAEPASPTTDEAIDQMAENTRANLAEFDAETKRLDAERAKAGASESPDLDKFVTAYSNYHLARIAREAKSGKQSPEYYDQQRAAWTPDNVRDRVIEFLKVIDTKDVATLDGYNNGQFDGFWKLFRIRTGMSPMPKTQTGIADVIRSYVGDEAWNANEKANEAARAKRAEESAAKDEEWRIRGLKADAARVQFKDGQNGEQWVDEVLADGWRVENVSNGPIPRYAFRKGDLEKGFGDKKQAKPLIAYAREAQKDMADPVDEEAAREEAEFNALPQEEQEAMNSLFAPGGTKPIPAKSTLTPDEQALEAFLEDIGGGLETPPPTTAEEKPPVVKRRRTIDSPARREAFRILNAQDTELTAINKILGGGGKLQSPPTGMLKIIRGLAGSRNLTEKQMAMQRRWMDYSAFQPKSAFGGTFNGKVAQELHGMLFTQDESSSTLDDWAGRLGGVANDKAMIEVMTELIRVSRGISKENDSRNPNRELSESEIAAETTKAATPAQNENFKESNDFDFGRNEIQVGDLNEGDTITIDGEEMTVEAVEDGGTVVLRDGTRFGRQTLDSGESVWVEADDSTAIDADQVEVEAKWLVDRSEAEGYQSPYEYAAADPTGFEQDASEAEALGQGDSSVSTPASVQEGSSETQGGAGEVSPKKSPTSKMDIRNADSKELFADDGGFKLGQDSTVDGAKIVAERKAKEDAKAAMDAAQGDIFAQPKAASKPTLTPDEQALEAFLEDIGGGLETSPLTPSEFYRSKGIPKDKRAAFLDVADQLYEAGVRTPADLAAKLSKIGGGKFKQYSHALWGGMVSSYPDLPNAEDWAGVYAALDQPANRDAETDAEFSSTKGKVMQKVSNDVRDLLLADEDVTVDRVKGLRPEVSTLSRKELDEAIEAGITAAARKAVQGGRSPEGIFKRLLGIYINQPSLNAKTSTSKINQAYSTPSPLAYVASRLADIAGGKVLTEPTGGHGMLMMESTADQVVQFNEIDQARHERTRLAIPESAGWKMTGEDATSWAPAQAPDRIAANPPFGSVMAEDGSNIAWFTVAGKTTSIDHAIMLKQLGSMTPGGRAVFIIGGPAKTARSESARKEHYGRGAKAEFFKHLHDNFGVVDHFTVDGDLYAKQGAGWNVDVIVIQGRKASRTSLPSAKAPRMLSTWDEVFQTTQLTDEQRIQLNRISEEEVRDSVRGMVDALTGIGNMGRPESPSSRNEPSVGADGAGGQGGDSISSESSGNEPSDNTGGSNVDGSRNEGTASESTAVDSGTKPNGESAGTGRPSERSGDTAGAVRVPVKKSGEFQVEYTPFSGEKGLDTLLPKNMVGPVAAAFERIKRDLGGNLTKFVFEKLGYPAGTDITEYLAGEQIDAVAAAIWNFERGGALIIGDQTGIGKGRIAAALMKYAVNQGFIPVFMTKDPGLHDAMLTEDLPDIASPEIIPAVMDTKLQFESAKKRKLNYGEEYFAEAATSGKLPGDSNAIFITYSQITADDAKELTKKDRATARNAGQAPADKWRMRALRNLAPNAVFILDESHLASGQSTTGWRVADILRRSSRVYYSSATSVKRPENMGIYFKTNVGMLTGGNMAELTELMNTGGVPAMQVVSSMLAQDGQYLRRERSFDGVKFITQIAENTYERDRELADGLTGSLRQIVTVQDAMRQAADAINGVIAQTGKQMGIPAANRAKLETVNFSSKLHNIVSQYLLAIKTQSAADTAIREIQAGKKVVVAVQSTMESAIDGLEFGGFEMSYKGLVQRYLDQMRFLTSGKKTFGKGEIETFEITEKGLPEFEGLTNRQLEARIVTTGINPETGDTTIEVNDKVAAELMRRSMWDVFTRSRDAIEATDLGDLPISPIDAMRQAVERAGIRTGEITGRKRGIDTNGEIYVRPGSDTTKPARRKVQSEFNNEDLDFLVINQSGSTGISLHASEKAKVQSTRVMIVAQPNLDINEFMQTLGRIHRSGQVVNPEFILLQTALPAEKRPAAILGKKMSMLNANTTSNAKTDVSEGNTAIDIFNQYGDEIAYKILERDSDLQDQFRPLGSSLDKFFNKETGVLIPYQDAQKATNDKPDGYIARTITGYLAILPVEEQEIFWEKTLADYNAYISYLDQIGQNALEAKALDLQAKTTSSEVFTEKAEGDSAFSAPSYIETVETKIGKTPLTGEKAVEMSVAGKAGSKQILQAYLASADAAANDLADKKAKRALKPWDSEKRSEFLSNQRAQRNVIASAISLIGRFGSVNRADGNAGIGMIEEIKLDEANPLTPSKQIAVLRVNDSRETLRVPLTQLNEAFTPAPNESAKEWDDSTDIGGESAIATGNLMAAMKALGGAGKVITYTTDAGVDQMGILLPKSFLTKRAAIKARVNADSAEKLIEMLDSGVRVTNGDGSIKWTKGATIVSLSVPAARATGGNIWRNPMLNRTSVGGEFTQVGNEMRATYYLKDVPAVFELLINAGETFSSEKPKESDGLRTASIPAADISPFFSQLSRAIEAKMPKQTTPAQVIQIAMSGAKADEVKWSGLVPAAQALAVDGKVSKEAVLKYLADEGSVRFEEVTLGVSKPIEWKQSGQSWSARSGKWSFDVEKLANGKYRMGVPGGTYSLHNSVAEFKAEAESMRERVGDSAQESPTKFAQYTLPGGENYREVVLAMPTEKPKLQAKELGRDKWVVVNEDGSPAETSGMTYYSKKSADYQIKQIGLYFQGNTYTSSHFPDVPNYVAHMRTNERDGGLFIEELQSDRHQAGRKEGYSSDQPEWFTLKNPATGETLGRFKTREMAMEYISPSANHNEAFAQKLASAQWTAEPIASPQGVADAPFRTTWPLALFKRALRDAVAGGKDWIGWTVGETQNNRFDLSKQVDAVSVRPLVNGNFDIAAKGKNGGQWDTVALDVTKDKLPDYLGKDLTSKIDFDNKSAQRFEGDSLKVGGSGMKGFYDTMLPKELGKYVKQWGGKVEKEAILSEAPKDMDEGRFYNSEGQWMNADRRNAFDDGFTLAEIPIWRIDITPAMKAGVSQGQSLFAATIPAADSSGQSPSENVDPSSNAPDRIAPGDKGESGLSPEGEIRRSRELAIAVFRGEAAASRSHLSEGSESVVERVGQDWTIKTIVPKGVMSYTRDGKLTRSTSFADVELKARFINLLGGFETHAVEDAGQSYLIQRYGKGFVSESELENLSLPFNLKAGHVNRVQLDDKEFIISDLHHKNFRRDENGKIRIIDLIVSEVIPNVSLLDDGNSSLLTATIPAAQNLESLKQRGRVAFAKARPLIEEAEGTIKDFGAGSLGVNPKFANFGGANQDARNQVDIVRAYDTFARETRADRDTFAKAKELLAKDPDGVEELALGAFGEGKPAIADHEQLAIEMFIQQRLAGSGDSRQAQVDNFVLIQANILNRRETARTLRIGFDKFMTPEERAHQQLADAIFRVHPKVEARAKTMTLAERKTFLAEAGSARIAEVEKELKKLGLRISQVIGKNRALQLENSRMMREVLKTRDLMDQKIIQAVQKGATLADIKRTLGKDAAAKAQEVATKARAELFEKIKAMAASGMSRDQIREALKDSLKSSPLGAASNGMTDADIWSMIEQDFGIAETIPERALPTAKPKKAKQEKLEATNPLSSNWARPEFTDGMNAYQFDTKDRAGIMERVEIIRGLAGSVGKIDSLQGDKRTQAEAKLKEINAILAKYGTDAAGIFDAPQGIESYGFDVTDIAQVAAVARAINAIDADVVDKASEYLYASMLSGLQTMLVNATAIVPAVWESTVGRGVNMAINRFVKDPMSEQSGEAKYILKALAPAITRAKSNFQASMAAQHPMFDRDVNAMEVDWDKILGGGSHKMIGSISGRKGDLIRIPMRLLTATDDFNRTLLACCEVGTFAYRIAKAKGMKPGSPEMDKFIRMEVNTPGSFSYQLASKKASSAIYSNPLPGQKDPHTGKPVPVRDLGDVVGFVASKITDAVSKEHDSIFLKAVSAAFRISFFPFQRTPFNIIRKGIRHTLNPFSLFDIGLGIVQNNRGANPDGTTKWEWNAQGRNPELIERAGQQLQGAILMTLLVGAAAGEGDDDDMDKPFVITGSLPFLPSNMAERDARMRSGIGAYRVSFRRKDGSERFGFSYGRMEPVATLLSSTIDTIKSVKRSDRAGGTSYDAAASAMGGFASQAQDKTFMRGVGDLIGLVKNIVAEPDIKENRKALQFLAGRVAMVVPNIIKQPIREMDPQFRDRSTGFMEEMLYQAAPYGQKPAKVDPYGQVLHKPGTAASRPLDVADTGTDTVNPIDRMLVKWSDSGKWSKAENPSDRKPWFPAPIMNAEFKHSKTGQNVKMNGGQLAEFREKAGKRAMVLLKAGNLNTQNPTARDVEKVKEIISKSRSDIKKMLAFKFSR